MRWAPAVRSRFLKALRRVVFAAAVGFGWFLLSGPAASAADALLGQTPSPPTPLSALVAPDHARAVALPVSPLVAPLPPVQSGVEFAQRAVAPVVESGASAVGSTVAELGSTVQSAPALVDPALTGLLEPLKPVVDTTAAVAALVVGSVGDTVAETVRAPIARPQLPVTPAEPPVLLPSQAGDTPPPAAGLATALVHDSAVASSGGPAASSDSSNVRSDGPGPAFAFFGSVRPPQAEAAYASSDDDRRPLPAPLLQASPSETSGGTSMSGGSSPEVAALAGSVVAPELLVLGRNRAIVGPMPSSPAFDPGSTPG